MSQKEPVKLCEIIAELLAYGGFETSTPPVLYVWLGEGLTERKVEITTFDQFLNIFHEGTCQVYIANPTIDYVDSEKVTVESLSVTLCYMGNSDWSEPHVQTYEEEITPTNFSMETFKAAAKERSKKIGEKVRGALTILSLVLELYRTIGRLSGS